MLLNVIFCESLFVPDHLQDGILEVHLRLLLLCFPFLLLGLELVDFFLHLEFAVADFVGEVSLGVVDGLLDVVLKHFLAGLPFFCRLLQSLAELLLPLDAGSLHLFLELVPGPFKGLGSLDLFLHLSHLEVALEAIDQELAFFVADVHEIAGVLSHGVLKLDPLLHVLLPLFLQVVLVAVVEPLQFVAVVLQLRVREVVHLFD